MEWNNEKSIFRLENENELIIEILHNYKGLEIFQKMEEIMP